ncbi:hypothetical protein V1477_016491 [Vespula maculifrons]|uniref:Uncharacterized protein n=1 Tax=Vespula maculifrons TaxID=7453 RepID=A0ABD2B998_VESMC
MVERRDKIPFSKDSKMNSFSYRSKKILESDDVRGSCISFSSNKQDSILESILFVKNGYNLQKTVYSESNRQRNQIYHLKAEPRNKKKSNLFNEEEEKKEQGSNCLIKLQRSSEEEDDLEER